MPPIVQALPTILLEATILVPQLRGLQVFLSIRMERIC